MDFWLDRSEATPIHLESQKDRWTRVSDILYQKRSPHDSIPAYDVVYMAPGRFVKPPDLAALSAQTCKSGRGLCQFCQALKSAFSKRYERESWWQQKGSRLRFLIRYDWKEGPGSLEHTLKGATVLVNGWLKQCLTHDKNCYRPADSSMPSFIPTRLLHFSLDSTNGQVTLVGGAMMRESTRLVNAISYAALSYCWGTGVTSKTTKENLAERQVKISISALPLVFREAILVAIRLGFVFL